MNRFKRLLDSLTWGAVSALEYEEEERIVVLERNRFTGEYRTVPGFMREESEGDL